MSEYAPAAQTLPLQMLGAPLQRRETGSGGVDVGRDHGPAAASLFVLDHQHEVVGTELLDEVPPAAHAFGHLGPLEQRHGSSLGALPNGARGR